jgi:hypothetical protein
LNFKELPETEMKLEKKPRPDVPVPKRTELVLPCAPHRFQWEELCLVFNTELRKELALHHAQRVPRDILWDRQKTLEYIIMMVERDEKYNQHQHLYKLEEILELKLTDEERVQLFLGNPCLFAGEPEELRKKKIELAGTLFIKRKSRKELEKELKDLKKGQSEKINEIKAQLEVIKNLEVKKETLKNERDKINRKIYYLEKKKSNDVSSLEKAKEEKECELDTVMMDLYDKRHLADNMERILKNNKKRFSLAWKNIFKEIETEKQSLAPAVDPNVSQQDSGDTKQTLAPTSDPKTQTLAFNVTQQAFQDTKHLESNENSKPSSDEKNDKPWILVVPRKILQKSLWLTKAERLWFTKVVTDETGTFSNKQKVLQGWDDTMDTSILMERIHEGMQKDEERQKEANKEAATSSTSAMSIDEPKPTSKRTATDNATSGEQATSTSTTSASAKKQKNTATKKVKSTPSPSQASIISQRGKKKVLHANPDVIEPMEVDKNIATAKKPSAEQPTSTSGARTKRQKNTTQTLALEEEMENTTIEPSQPTKPSKGKKGPPSVHVESTPTEPINESEPKAKGQGSRQRKARAASKKDAAPAPDDPNPIKGTTGVEVIVNFLVTQLLKRCIMYYFDVHDACAGMFYSEELNHILRRMFKGDLINYFQ